MVFIPCLSNHFIPLDPGPRTRINPDPQHCLYATTLTRATFFLWLFLGSSISSSSLELSDESPSSTGVLRFPENIMITACYNFGNKKEIDARNPFSD
mgnify:CR=1 FL=1